MRLKNTLVSSSVQTDQFSEDFTNATHKTSMQTLFGKLVCNFFKLCYFLKFSGFLKAFKMIFLLLLRSAVAVMTLTHLIFDSLSPTYSTVAHGNHCTNKLTHILWLSADSLSGVLMHAGVTLLSYTDVSSGKSHSHLQTISSPQCWSIYGQPRQAQQRTHKAHTPGFKSSWQPSCLDSVDHRATVQIVQYKVLSPTNYLNTFFTTFSFK